ncbi:potassium/proton antiporter [Evansella clarkii]|jgi:cell volume regulation protein A|uniref:potassium/proton antiporter n=1 Tax=Evansella clarkii TaxID=79879 RepID=UPI000998806B|nr:potassium/proton antiporter [Evansella clarkii]
MEEQLFKIDYILLMIAAILITGVIISKVSQRFQVPSLIFFIFIGMLIGEEGLALLEDYSIEWGSFIGIFALVVILFEGGLSTKWRDLKPVIGPATTLATGGVLFTSVFFGLLALLILDLSLLEALLLGALIGSTDAAAVFANLKNKKLPPRLSKTIEAESGYNDPMAVFLTVSAVTLVQQPDQNYLLMAGNFVWQMGGGLLAGFALGTLFSKFINRLRFEERALYSVFSLSVAFIIYSTTSLIGASGFLAVYVAAVIIGNNKLKKESPIYHFNEGFASTMQMTMFVVLGMMVYPSELFSLNIIIQGILLAVILMFIARPAAVLLCTFFTSFNIREKLFLSWAGLRGAAPIILAMFPMLAGIDRSEAYFNIVFFIVIISAVVQGSTISFAAEKLKVNSKD